MSIPIRVIIADDHELFRVGIAAMIQNTDGMELVAEAWDGAMLIKQVELHEPDVVVTDIQMEPVRGTEAIRVIHKQFPAIPVLALSMYQDDYDIIEMLEAGAMGYLVKNAGMDTVIEAIRAAAAGKTYYCRTSTQKISALVASGRFDLENRVSRGFNPTEIRIIKAICQDKDTQQIANELSMSFSTVKKYRMDILAKTDTKSTAGLIMYAITHGIYKP